MGIGPLFKWEDHASLEHHCGDCRFSLDRPRAKTSCFVNHITPCARYHQSYTCKSCTVIDEAHHHRHEAIAKQLRTVYESCGEVGWTIIPSDADNTVTETAREVNNDSSSCIENEHTDASGDKIPSERERKDAKKRVRAGSRAHILTQEEIGYVRSVIHSADEMTGHDLYELRNPKEIKKIEKQLRDQAELYHAKGNKGKLKRPAGTPSDISKVDFEAEMDRILTAFRITELLKRNTKTKGMRGKELKTFKALVRTFKQSIIDDIILAKTDELEVCMRRASYLRYATGKSSRTMKDRHSSIGRKTEERSTKRVRESVEIETEIETEEEGSDPVT